MKCRFLFRKDLVTKAIHIDFCAFCPTEMWSCSYEEEFSVFTCTVYIFWFLASGNQRVERYWIVCSSIESNGRGGPDRIKEKASIPIDTQLEKNFIDITHFCHERSSLPFYLFTCVFLKSGKKQNTSFVTYITYICNEYFLQFRGNKKIE